MPSARRAVVAVVLVLCLCSCPSLAQGLPKDLDSFVGETMKAFDVPGIALAVVKDGRVVVAKGYGVRKLGEAAAVDENTLFGIASNSKAFTAAALAILVDEGKISWDDPAIKYLPNLQLYDPYVTRELTVRDLLCHRSGLGLGAGDLLWFPHTIYSRDDIIYRLRYIKPASSFRSHYAYDNVLYIAAGQIIPAVTGKSWDDFVRERIFKPLGMSNAVTTHDDLLHSANFATSHARLEGKMTPIPPMDVDNIAAAGGIDASVSDLAKWMIVQLNAGKLAEGKRLFSERQSREMWTPQTILPISDPLPPLAKLRPLFAAYGLGWNVRDYQGHRIIQHSGGLPGYVSLTTLVPDQNMGIVVLTNAEEGGAHSAITYHVVDSFIGVQPTDWLKAQLEAKKLRRADADMKLKKYEERRATASKPSLPIAQYAGEYLDPWYGRATVREENGKLLLSFDQTPGMVGELEHWHYDTFKVHWRDRTIEDAWVTFWLNADGSVNQFKMAAVSPLADFSFDYQDLLFTPMAKSGTAGK